MGGGGGCAGGGSGGGGGGGADGGAGGAIGAGGDGDGGGGEGEGGGGSGDGGEPHVWYAHHSMLRTVRLVAPFGPQRAQAHSEAFDASTMRSASALSAAAWRW